MLKSTTKYICKESSPIKNLIFFATNFIDSGKPAVEVVEKATLIHTDGVLSAFAAISLHYPIPRFYRQFASNLIKNELSVFKIQKHFSTSYGLNSVSMCKNSILADICATSQLESTAVNRKAFTIDGKQRFFVRSLDLFSLITNAQQTRKSLTGEQCVRAMIVFEEIRSILFDIFIDSPKKIQPIVFDVISCVIIYGTLIDASAYEIETAVTLYIHFYTGSFLDSNLVENVNNLPIKMKAIENGLTCLEKSMAGFRDQYFDPKTGFSIFERLFPESIKNFPSELSFSGIDFSLMKTDFRFGVFGHQNANLIECFFQILHEFKFLSILRFQDLMKITIFADSSIFSEIDVDKGKWPTDSDEAQRSSCYILAQLVFKAFLMNDQCQDCRTPQEYWEKLMLNPLDFEKTAIDNKNIKDLANRISIISQNNENGFNDETKMGIKLKFDFKSTSFESKIVAFRENNSLDENENIDGGSLLEAKFQKMGELSLNSYDFEEFMKKMTDLDFLSPEKMRVLFRVNLKSKQ